MRHHLYVRASGLLCGLGLRSVSLGRCGLLFGGSAPFAAVPVEVLRTATGATHHQTGHQEGTHHSYEVYLANHGVLTFS
jgi:hypothetical protein